MTEKIVRGKIVLNHPLHEGMTVADCKDGMVEDISLMTAQDLYDLMEVEVIDE